MKTLLTISFSFFFLLSTIPETTLLLLYKLNEKSITEKYCVNKAKLEKHCNGKCHLKKTIEKTVSETAQNPFSVLNLKVKEVEIYLQQFYQTYEVCITSDITTAGYGRYFNTPLLDGVSSAPVKPPAVLA